MEDMLRAQSEDPFLVSIAADADFSGLHKDIAKAHQKAGVGGDKVRISKCDFLCVKGKEGEGRPRHIKRDPTPWNEPGELGDFRSVLQAPTRPSTSAGRMLFFNPMMSCSSEKSLRVAGLMTRYFTRRATWNTSTMYSVSLLWSSKAMLSPYHSFMPSIKSNCARSDAGLELRMQSP